MKIAATQFNLESNAIEIYLSGCLGNCPGCHNLELKDFNIGQDFNSETMYQIKSKILQFDNLIEKIFVMGGEPLDQDLFYLKWFLNYIKTTNKEIWLFTRYELNEISPEVKNLCDYIKTGWYNEKLKIDNYISYGIKLATNNQKVNKRGEDY